MKRLFPLASVLAVSAAFAAEPPWVALFNGRDFTGWKIVGPANLAPAEVVDGEMLLHMRRNTPEHTFVATDEKYGRGYLALKIHALGDKPEAEKIGVHYRNIRMVTDAPQNFAQPMDLPARRANP